MFSPYYFNLSVINIIVKKWNLIRKRKIAPILHPEKKVQRTVYRTEPSRVHTEEDIEMDAYIY